MFAAPDSDQRPKCADPAVLPLVDAAFAKPGGPAGRQMRDQLCTRCPVAAECFAHAMAKHESGMWAGTSPHGRTRHGAPGGMQTEQRRRRNAA